MQGERHATYDEITGSYETDPLTCPKCQGEMRIISFIDQPGSIKKILEHLGLWE